MCSTILPTLLQLNEHRGLLYSRSLYNAPQTPAFDREPVIAPSFWSPRNLHRGACQAIITRDILLVSSNCHDIIIVQAFSFSHCSLAKTSYSYLSKRFSNSMSSILANTGNYFDPRFCQTTLKTSRCRTLRGTDK